MSVRSTAMRPGSLSRLPAARPPFRLRQRPRSRIVLDRRLAVGAHLPQRFERPVAAHARLPQLRRAHRADEEVLLHLGTADRAVEVAGAEALLDRLDLEPPLADVLEV